MNTELKILVVDDEPSILQLCQLVLPNEGFQVTVAHGGRQAVRLLNKSLPDLVLLDVMMPDLDGIAVCRHIRTEFSATPITVIMYTADERDSTRDNCFAAGADHVFSKDISISTLPSKIKEAVNNTRKRETKPLDDSTPPPNLPATTL